MTTLFTFQYEEKEKERRRQTELQEASSRAGEEEKEV